MLENNGEDVLSGQCPLMRIEDVPQESGQLTSLKSFTPCRTDAFMLSCPEAGLSCVDIGEEQYDH